MFSFNDVSVSERALMLLVSTWLLLGRPGLGPVVAAAG
jgi:hypothetical protein